MKCSKLKQNRRVAGWHRTGFHRHFRSEIDTRIIAGWPQAQRYDSSSRFRMFFVGVWVIFRLPPQALVISVQVDLWPTGRVHLSFNPCRLAHFGGFGTALRCKPEAKGSSMTGPWETKAVLGYPPPPRLVAGDRPYRSRPRASAPQAGRVPLDLNSRLARVKDDVFYPLPFFSYLALGTSPEIS